MATVKVYGVSESTNTRRALACLYEKQVEFELVTVEMANGDHKKEPFISLNPFGQVPAYEDGDIKLFESRAITSYVAHAYPNKGSPLVAFNAKAMAPVGLWMEVEAHQFDPIASKLTWELFYKPMFGQTTDPAQVSALEGKLAKVLDVYESRLTQSKYLGGDSFTLADLNHLPCIGFLVATQSKELFYSRPHLGAWCNEILARPAWKKATEA